MFAYLMNLKYLRCNRKQTFLVLLLFWHKQFGPRSGPSYQNVKSDLSLTACHSDRILEKKPGGLQF